jgi:hypothetical protein
MHCMSIAEFVVLHTSRGASKRPRKNRRSSVSSTAIRRLVCNTRNPHTYSAHWDDVARKCRRNSQRIRFCSKNVEQQADPVWQRYTADSGSRGLETPANSLQIKRRTGSRSRARKTYNSHWIKCTEVSAVKLTSCRRMRVLHESERGSRSCIFSGINRAVASHPRSDAQTTDFPKAVAAIVAQ